MPRRLLFVLVGLAVFPAACLGHPTQGGGPVPVPVDLASPQVISQGLAQTWIPWWIGEGATQQGVYIRIDGTDPQSIPAPEYAVGGARSLSGRYFVYGTSPLPGGDIELLDAATGERSTLVDGADRFPGARLTSPSFTPDERSVVFEVATEDRTDLAFVELYRVSQSETNRGSKLRHTSAASTVTRPSAATACAAGAAPPASAV